MHEREQSDVVASAEWVYALTYTQADAPGISCTLESAEGEVLAGCLWVGGDMDRDSDGCGVTMAARDAGETLDTIEWPSEAGALDGLAVVDQAGALAYASAHGECVRRAVADDGGEEDYPGDSYTAREAAQAYVDGCEWGDDGDTHWVDVHVHTYWRRAGVEVEDPSEAAVETITREPREPECSDPAGHDWVSPYAVLGGLRENPGVQGHGGGVTIHRVCAHCGCLRIYDSWAQRRDTGEQGLASTSYALLGDHDYTDAWREWRASEEVES